MATSSRSAPAGLAAYLPQGRWLLVGGAFLLGWLLFALVWLAGRGDDAVTVGPAKPVAAPEAFEPLPRPMAAGDAATPSPAPADEAPRLVEEAPASAAAEQPVETTPLPPSIDETAPVAGETVQAPAPLPDQSPSPRYPVTALRRNETGTVVLQVHVDAQGQPVSVDVAERSGSRDLDRAAVEAVSRWRFSPARDASGNPVAGALSVPIDFKLE
jgi:protein TonB